ncbi:MAG: MBL fold metallo-hydrolase, partial [Candidatus Hodarchaeota archaeon]
MLISFLGTRGTVPTAKESTVSFLIDNQFLFDACTEVVQSFERLLVHWRALQNAGQVTNLISRYGNPSISRIEHIFLTHLHWDHWGGVIHLLHRALMLDRELREKKPIKIYVPKKSVDLLRLRLYINLGSEVGEIAEVIPLDHGETLRIGSYRITTALTQHHPLGSLAYQIEFIKTKLKVEKARELGIPFNSNLSEIDKGKKIAINGVTISREDVFYDVIESVGYTGDISRNMDLKTFFNKVNVLIVESTYL